ncbi:MAG TPA: hypothetical protein VKT77_11110 [Chthonomonadaceae bacterium]|nr:hypothetical protein [Chthonomonadaceae bacterium]
MATSTSDLKAMLETDSATIYSDGAETLLYWFAHSGQSFNILCEVAEEGEYVRFTLPFLLCLADAADREAALAALLEINRRVKALKFAYDPTDGEVSATVEILVEDGPLTERQVHRSMFLLTNVAMSERDNLLTLLRTGVYPGSSDPAFTDRVSRLIEPADDPLPEDPA